jgi:hypothetical protein
MRVHNISENGRGAWVALYAHPIHTDTDSSFTLTILNIMRLFHHSPWMIESYEIFSGLLVY